MGGSQAGRRHESAEGRVVNELVDRRRCERVVAGLDRHRNRYGFGGGLGVGDAAGELEEFEGSVGRHVIRLCPRGDWPSRSVQRAIGTEFCGPHGLAHTL